ncbi:GDP-mannose 4,6-dehydratase [Streptomyces sp. NPDC056468]|uniref:GDP-mannose 4,6-dehydratase n=1 Tax=Streptomyces sp. NPDC056468 TaxID=3345830 RepID=UPI0036C94722
MDIRDQHALSPVFDRHQIDAVVHFAARKAVGESMRMLAEYYEISVCNEDSGFIATASFS